MKKIFRILAITLIVGLFAGEVGGRILINEVEASSKIGIQISHKKTDIIKGQKQQLYITGTTKTIKWSSSNKKVASVSKRGVVTAKKKGSVTIKAKIGKKVLKCKVNVISTGLNQSKLSLGKNDTFKLKVLNNKKKVRWKSNNKKICIVSSNGKVKAKKKGKTLIVAKVGKKSYKCEIVVKDNEVKKKDKSGTYEFVYKPEVKKDELKSEKSYTTKQNGDEISVSIKKDKNTKTVSSGDVIVLPTTSKDKTFALKVMTVTESNGKLIFTGKAAEYTDVFEDIDFNSEKGFDYSNFVSAGYAAVDNEKKYLSGKKLSSVSLSYTGENKDKVSVEVNKDSLKVKLKTANGIGGFDNTITFSKPKLNTDIDISIKDKKPTINKCKIMVTEETKVSVGFRSEYKNDFYLGCNTVPIKDGFAVDILWFLKFNMTGKVSLSAVTTVSTGINYYAGKNHSAFTSDLSYEKTALEANASLKHNIQFSLRWGGYWDKVNHVQQFAVRIINIGVTIGPAVEISSSYYSTKPNQCFDAKLYLAISLGIDNDYGVGKFIARNTGLALEWNILENNDKNPFRFSWHIEDGSVVDRCTHNVQTAEESHDDTASETTDDIEDIGNDNSPNAESKEDSITANTWYRKQLDDIKNQGINIYSFSMLDIDKDNQYELIFVFDEKDMSEFEIKEYRDLNGDGKQEIVYLKNSRDEYADVCRVLTGILDFDDYEKYKDFSFNTSSSMYGVNIYVNLDTGKYCIRDVGFPVLDAGGDLSSVKCDGVSESWAFGDHIGASDDHVGLAPLEYFIKQQWFEPVYVEETSYWHDGERVDEDAFCQRLNSLMDGMVELDGRDYVYNQENLDKCLPVSK